MSDNKAISKVLKKSIMIFLFSGELGIILLKKRSICEIDSLKSLSSE